MPKKTSAIEKELVDCKEQNKKTLEKLECHIKKLDETNKELKDSEEVCKTILAENEKLNQMKNNYDAVEKTMEELKKKEKEDKKIMEDLNVKLDSLEKETERKIMANNKELRMEVQIEKDALNNERRDFEQKLRNLERDQNDFLKMKSEFEEANLRSKNDIVEKDKELDEREAKLREKEEEKSASIYGLRLLLCRLCYDKPADCVLGCGHMLCRGHAEELIKRKQKCPFDGKPAEELMPIFYT